MYVYAKIMDFSWIDVYLCVFLRYKMYIYAISRVKVSLYINTNQDDDRGTIGIGEQEGGHF